MACYVLTSIYNLGVVGIGIAFSITETIKLLLLIAYLLHYDVGLVKLEFDGSVIHGIFLTLKQTSSSIIMMCLEFWMFEVITIMSGFFPSREINI